MKSKINFSNLLEFLAKKFLIFMLFTTTVMTAAYGQSAKKYSIGDKAQGGIIFWVDESGEHGLVAAPSDQDTAILWYNVSPRGTGATGDGRGAGLMNTMLIIARQIDEDINGRFAAKVCADLVVTDSNGVEYGDWYLPSKWELEKMCSNLRFAYLGDFASDAYWSSTETSSMNAWCQNFYDGYLWRGEKELDLRVRAIRAF